MIGLSLFGYRWNILFNILEGFTFSTSWLVMTSWSIMTSQRRNVGHRTDVFKWNCRFWTVVLLVIMALCQKTSAAVQENRDDIVDYTTSYLKDLITNNGLNLDHLAFSIPNVIHFTNIQPYPKDNAVFISAANNVFKLNASDLSLQDRHTWNVTDEMVQDCLKQSYTPEHCGKYQVKVFLLSNRTQNSEVLFVCHTDGKNPACSERFVNNLSRTRIDFSGDARCPIDPNQNVTALIASDGHLYLGAVLKKDGRDPAIVRLPLEANPQAKDTLRTRNTMSWLEFSEPVSFVESFEYGPYIYFIFREVAEELEKSCKITGMVSRIARICMSDKGDSRMANHWTSFHKATLSCPITGPEGDRLFNNVQRAHVDIKRGIIYATFTSTENAPAGSVLCEYDLKKLDTIFNGQFFQSLNIWKPTTYNNSVDCSAYTTSDRISYGHFTAASKYQLMFNPVVPPRRRKSIIARKDGERWSQVAVDRITRGDVETIVFFVVTSRGSIRKLHQLSDKTICFVEEIVVDKRNIIKINDLAMIDKHLIISTNESIYRVALHRCHRLSSLALCTAAQDPYCTWDHTTSTCTHLPFSSTPITSCPHLAAPIDGGWSTWSPWQPCHSPSNPFQLPINATVGLCGCQCRHRRCTAPIPSAGGQPCEKEDSTEVMGCAWLGPWSDWGPCSRSCETGLRVRKRDIIPGVNQYCSSEKEQKEACVVLPNCPILAPEPQWEQWSEWTPCEPKCAETQRSRTRACIRGGHNGEIDCDGSATELRTCPLSQCKSYSSVTEWSAWLSNGSNMAYQQRFRGGCTILGMSPSATQAKLLVQDRICGDGSCGENDSEYKLEPWSDWGMCNRLCGTGRRTRIRDCSTVSCDGNNYMQVEMCNDFPCTGMWTCWGDWGECSAKCGVGRQIRQRFCRDQENNESQDCTGGSYKEARRCVNPIPCPNTEGWSEWAQWSDCYQGQITRRRRCLGIAREATSPNQLCIGDEEEKQLCDGRFHKTAGVLLGSTDAESQKTGNFQMMHLIVVGIISFAAGAVIVTIVMLLVCRRRQKKSTPSTDLSVGYRSQLDSKRKELPRLHRKGSFLSSVPDSEMGLLDNTSSLYYSTPSHKMDTLYRDTPWTRQSQVDDIGYVYGTYGRRQRTRTLTTDEDTSFGPESASMMSSPRYTDLTPMEYPTLPTSGVTDYSTMPYNGMSTFGRGTSNRNRNVASKISEKPESGSFTNESASTNPSGRNTMASYTPQMNVSNI